MAIPATRGQAGAKQDTSLIGFYKDMNASERRTFWACFGGWSLDGVDFMVYPLVLSTIIATWHVSRGLAGLSATLTLLASAIGGWLAGYFSDRIGRVRMLQITILWFSGFTFLCALSQSFLQLTIFRALLGIGFGGEWAAGAVLMGETIRPRYRGRAVGSVQSGWAVGWGISVLIQAIAYTLLPPALAWRVMFGIGILPAFLVFFLRRYVEEPAVARKAREVQQQTGEHPGMLEIFRRGIFRTTALAALLTTGAQGGYYVITIWLPTYLKSERGLTVVGSTGYLAFLIVGSFSGYIFGAWFSDRVGRRALFILFSVCAAAGVYIYTTIPLTNTSMLLLGFPLGFFASGYYSGLGPFLTELFPTRLRGSGQGFAYNFGRGIGALFPALVGFLSAHMSLASAMAFFGVLSYGVFFLAALLLPETVGRELTVADQPA